MEKECSFKGFSEKATEKTVKRNKDYFLKFACMETNPLLDEISPINNLIHKGFSDMRRKEEEQIEHILRNWIDDPILGNITKDSLKQRCIRTILYKEYNEMDSKLEQSGENMTFTIKSGLLGVVQGDYLIGINGERSLLTEEQNRRLFEMGV